MKYRNPKKDSDLFSMIDYQREITQAIRWINKLNAVVEWELFRPELEPLQGFDNRDSSNGRRPPFDLVLMLKVLVIQKYHNLSDEQTIWDFKQLLDKDGRDEARNCSSALLRSSLIEG